MFSILPFLDEAFILLAGTSRNRGPVEVSCGILKHAVINVVYMGKRWGAVIRFSKIVRD